MRYIGWPPNGHPVCDPWPHGENWIRFPARGGWFTEDAALESLYELLADKTERYGGAGTGFDQLCLVAYYNSALIYNTPLETPHFGFKNAADWAKGIIDDDPAPFHRIFLFVAINGGCVWTITDRQ